MTTPADKHRAFRRLHESGCFVMPNPWDVGSAKYLQHLGFPALASTSAGAAWAMGLADGAVTRPLILAHLAELAASTDLPLNADFEAGFADSAEGVGESVALCVASGVSGLSIEDHPGPGASALYDLDTAVSRLRAARKAIDAAGGEVLLTARSEGFIRGFPDLDETIRRLTAYAEVGADCLYAPGLQNREQIAAVVQAIAPRPVNFLVLSPGAFTVADLAQIGVRRISLGGALARAAWGGLARSAKLIADLGSFEGLAEALPGGEIVAALKPAP